MQNYSSIIVGSVTINGKKYKAELIEDTLAIGDDIFFNKEAISKIVLNTVEFAPSSHGDPIYYLFIDKRKKDYYSYTTFHVYLLYRQFKNTKNIRFEIISKGFTNSLNKSFRFYKNPLRTIKYGLNKDFLSTPITIRGKEFILSFTNIGTLTNNNLCPADFNTSLNLQPIDGKFIESIYDVFEFAIESLQFITLNTYSIVDSFIIRNDVGGYSEVEIFDDFSEYDRSNDKFLYLRCLSNKNVAKAFSMFPGMMTRQHNLYHYKRGWVFEFDIVRLSGSFEGVFRENVEKNCNYLKLLEKRKKEIHYSQLSSILNEFAKKYSIKSNEDYRACTQMFHLYGGTLKNKLEFTLDDFCRTLDLIIIEYGFFYSADKFEIRLKDSRNSICHGLNNKKIDWKNLENDTLLLQELIYFILLKYKVGLTKLMMRKVFDVSFSSLNKRLSLYNKGDPRIKWVD